VRRFAAGYLSALLTVATMVAIAAHSNGHHLPHSGKPCQLVQIKYSSGWSEPMTKSQARDRTDGHTDPRRIRFVPLKSSQIYEARHSPELIGCLIAHRFGGLSPAKARSVAWCESRYNPLASNGWYENVFQTRARTLRMHQGTTNLGQADKLPGGVALHNGYGGVFGALRWASISGWDPWSCA